MNQFAGLLLTAIQRVSKTRKYVQNVANVFPNSWVLDTTTAKKECWSVVRQGPNQELTWVCSFTLDPLFLTIQVDKEHFRVVQGSTGIPNITWEKYESKIRL
jgi:hypothetical protein